ncbi:MAG: hypothetical protein IJV27_06695 [Prevotella sp.]|nr:hypothetical protein [Prevotella sp.]
MINSFTLSVSAQKYADKNSIPWATVKYHHEEMSIRKFVELIKQGYCFCQCFNTNHTEFGVREKRDDNFKSAQMVFVDVDDVAIPMNEFVAQLTKKPTVAYTTPNNHTEKSHWLYRFRLCYLMEEPITTITDYSRTYDAVILSVSKDIPNFQKMKDNCGRKPSQQFGGNARTDSELIETDNVYSFSDFPFENNNVSFSFYKSETEKTHRGKTDIVITDADFMDDLNRLSPIDLIDKYRYKYPYFCHTELHFENGYAIIPKDYQEIYRSWYMDTYEKDNGSVIKVSVIKKHRDGDGRRKKLFIAGLIMKQIQPTITYEHLLCNLIYERLYYYDNSDKALTNEVLKGIAKNVVKTPIEDIHLQNRNKKRFVVDKAYCAMQGITANTMKNRVRKMLKDEEIGSVYDCSKSVSENKRLMNEMGIKVGKTKLYDWCKENGINTKGVEIEKTNNNVLYQLQLYYTIPTREDKIALLKQIENTKQTMTKAVA